MKLHQVFYIVGFVAFIVLIHSLLQKDNDENDNDHHNIIVVPGFNYRFHGPRWWGRFRRNLPWVGPRPGGRRPYHRPHHRRPHHNIPHIVPMPVPKFPKKNKIPHKVPMPNPTQPKHPGKKRKL